MSEVVLFHHVQGLTDGVAALAQRWAEAGHTVHVPDLFEGRRFDSIEEGFAHVQGLGGFGQVGVLAEQAVADLPTDIVYAGISMGVVPAMHLAATRPGARAGVLLEAFVSPDDIGPWPADAPVQVHGMDGDEFFAHEGDLEAARAFAASHDDVEVFTYPGSGHLFVDSALTSYDADATALVTERVLGLLDRL